MISPKQAITFSVSENLIASGWMDNKTYTQYSEITPFQAVHYTRIYQQQSIEIYFALKTNTRNENMLTGNIIKYERSSIESLLYTKRFQMASKQVFNSVLSHL